MVLMLLTLLMNVLILVAFKLFPKFEVNNLSAIIVNYFTAVATGSFVLGEFPVSNPFGGEPWGPYALLLGFIFVTVFNIVALTLQKTGVVIGALFQKMSLIFPVLAAIFIFSEDAGFGRVMGIILTIASIVIINLPTKEGGDFNLLKKYWYLPMLTFIGSGLVEFFLYYVDVTGIAPNGDIHFVSTLFFTAGVLGLLFKLIVKRSPFHWKDFVAGICLGIPNFFSIYLLLLTLSSGIDASVFFPFLNLGTILASVLLGVFVFREKMGLNKSIGVVVAVIAIYLIVS